MSFLTKYGYGTIGIIAIIAFILIVLAILIQNDYFKYGLVIVSILIMGFTLNFFRDPDRSTPNQDNIVVSPADGKILIVKDVVDDRFINGDAQQISIFMSPLDVHVNRIPISGQVDYLNYVSGDYLVAYHDKADKRNERNEIGITSKHGKVLFTQVAGMVARRIISELKTGDRVKIGERFGMIKFGSRVDVIVDKNWSIKVREGDHVTAGETILYEIEQ